jgi:hypothetical protein
VKLHEKCEDLAISRVSVDDGHLACHLSNQAVMDKIVDGVLAGGIIDLVSVYSWFSLN